MNALTPLMPSDMDQAIRLAKAMSSARMLPKHLQDDVGTCLMIVEQAMRWGMSPFAVAQCTSSIGGKLMFEGKLVAAAVESSGTIEGHFDYGFSGEGDDRQVTVSARRRGETNDRQLTIKLRDVRTNNEHWKKQPDQMLVYSGTRNWARRYAPAVLLGVYSPEEFNRDGRPTDDFVGTTLETKAEPSASSSGREQINREVPLSDVPLEPQPQKMSWGQWADSLEISVREATNAELGRLLARAEVTEIYRLAKEGKPSPAKQRIIDAMTEAEERYLADPPEPEEDAPHIVGEEKVLAG